MYNKKLINRELSFIEFNQRVLGLAEDKSLPLLERLRFLCISSTNLDEFFEVRVGSLKQQVQHGLDLLSEDGQTAEAQLRAISLRAHAFVEEQYRVFNDVVVPALAEQGIEIVRRNHWNAAQKDWIAEYFARMLLPVLTPMNLDPAHPFPRTVNKSLNFIVSLEGKDAFGRECRYAIVQAPRSLPRIIRLPNELSGNNKQFVFLSSIMHAHVGDLFPGMDITGCYQFRVTRNSDLFVDPEETNDLLQAVEAELFDRHFGEAVRLEVADNCPAEVSDFLLGHFQLSPADLYQVNGLVNLNRLTQIYDLAGRPDLKFPNHTPQSVQSIDPESTVNIFEVIGQQQDVLIHHPFQAFTPVIEFVRQAAEDPNVLAIRQTLYRTGTKSPLVDALCAAARRGKEVTVVIELKARFDEEANVQLATRLQNSNVQVVYGVVNLKTHAKLTLIVRREGENLRRYAHLGTGNYHASTARFYTDYGLFTCDPAVCEDVHAVFQQLTGLGAVRELQQLWSAPFSLHSGVLAAIDREIAAAKASQKAQIKAKMNSLIEPQVIEKMYEASQAGVEIDLIVRGVCGLRPGVSGLSENIRVRSILGRFLEHHRVYYFYNGGQEDLYLSSADWMPRNFFRRVEVAFPIRNPKLKARVLEEIFENYLADNCFAWLLQSDGHYQRLRPEGGAVAYQAQQVLLEKYR